jgi:hypothetical protein
MDYEALRDRLTQAYTPENLNRITYKIIAAYRNRNYVYIRNLAGRIGIQDKKDRINRLFLKLIALYHPDRLAYYRRQITALDSRSDTKRLDQLAHIFQSLEYVDSEKTISQAEFAAADDQDETDIWHSPDPARRNRAFDPAEFKLWPIDDDRDFLSALKHKEYGNTGAGFSEYDLSLIDEIELSGYGISDLTGIHLCTSLSSLDLSSNNISDINGLHHLHLLEDIDLSFNRVVDIGALIELQNLGDIDLSFNRVRDILPLLNLNSLKHLNITGNPIPASQAHEFHKREIIIGF